MVNGGDVLICIPVKNRMPTTLLCVPSVADTRGGGTLWVDDDNSYADQNCLQMLAPMCDRVTQRPENQCAEHSMRARHIAEFLDTSFSLLYLADNDSLHDPSWMGWMISAYARYGKPVTLYRTPRHCGRKTAFSGGMGLVRTPPGNSVLIDRKIAEAFIKIHVPSPRNRFSHWEHSLGAAIRATVKGEPICTPEVSLVEHYGHYGVHFNPANEDRADNPSEWLRARRNADIAALSPRAEVQWLLKPSRLTK